MSFYHLPTSTERHPGRLEAKLSDGYRIGPPDTGWTPGRFAAACGFVPIVAAARPADTGTHTTDRSVVLVDGVPTEQWTPREWTADEIAARNATDPRATLLAEVQAATTVAKLRAAVLAAIEQGAL